MVLESKKAKRGVIVHKADTGQNDIETFQYSAIRAGLSFPTVTSDGHYLILAEEFIEKSRYEGVEKPRGKFIFLSEGSFSGLNLNDLFKELTDDCASFSADKVFTILERPDEDKAVHPYQEYLRNQSVYSVQLCDAPYGNDFLLGFSILKQWLKESLLQIPADSQILDELKQIQRQDLDDVAEKYPGINALRYVLGAFYKFKPSNGPGFRPTRKGPSRKNIKLSNYML